MKPQFESIAFDSRTLYLSHPVGFHKPNSKRHYKTFAGGTDDHEIGTSLAKITAALEDNSATEILAFYDLGSAKMNLEMASEFSTKPVHLYDTALVEGAYVSASLLQAGVDLPEIEKQLELLQIKGDL